MSRPLTKLYIAKFGNNVGRREIEDTFGKYGELYSCNVNQREGYATVSYKYQEQAEKAISKLNGSDQFGGNLLVEHTLKKSRDDDYSRPPRSDRYGSNSYRDQSSGYRGGSSRYGDRGSDRDSNRDRDRGSGRDRDREGSDRRTSGPPRVDKEKFIKDGLCFNCGGQGHISRKCPEARTGGSSRGGTPGFRSDRERRPYRERSRSYDRNKGRSSRKDSRSKSPYDKYDSRDKDRKRRSKKSSKRSSSSSSRSNKSESKSRRDRKRSNSSSQSSKSNSNSSRSGSASNQRKQSIGDKHQNGNPNDQKKDINSSQ